MFTNLRVFLGYDPREKDAYRVASRSIFERTSIAVDLERIDLEWLRGQGVYWRPTEHRNGQLWDVVSDAPMSTEHAISRFFVPHLAEWHGWALSADCDILCRADLAELFARADARYAVMVVKHQHVPTDIVKMDGQIQTTYARKNWSSVMLWNCSHLAHTRLTFDVLNTWPGRDLHAFRWLRDDQIGTLPVRWNWLAGVSDPHPDPALVHYTLGTPDMPGYEAAPFADEWRGYLRQQRVVA